MDATLTNRADWVPDPSVEYQQDNPNWNKSAPDEAAETADAIRKLLSIQAWAAKDIPPPDHLLGDLLTTTTRMFLVGRTGLGKTHMGLRLACGMAGGPGFLHWRCSRPARVVYIDGEMPSELIKSRSPDELRRASDIPP